MLWGVSDGFFNIDKTNIELGRQFTAQEDKSLAQVVILGYGIKQDLFGDENALGKKIKINKSKFKIIGVREKMGGGGFMDWDQMIILPVSLFQ